MIHITDNFYLDADDTTFVLLESRVVQSGKRAGETVYDNLGYCTTAAIALQTLRRVLQRRMAKKDSHMDLLALLQAYQRLDSDFKAWAERVTREATETNGG